jgi:hypothetical protein
LPYKDEEKFQKFEYFLMSNDGIVAGEGPNQSFIGCYSKDAFTKKKKKWIDCMVRVNSVTRQVTVTDIEEGDNGVAAVNNISRSKAVYSGIVDRRKMDSLLTLESEVQVGTVCLQLLSSSMEATASVNTSTSPRAPEVLSVSSLIKPFKTPNSTKVYTRPIVSTGKVASFLDITPTSMGRIPQSVSPAAVNDISKEIPACLNGFLSDVNVPAQTASLGSVHANQRSSSTVPKYTSGIQRSVVPGAAKGACAQNGRPYFKCSLPLLRYQSTVATVHTHLTCTTVTEYAAEQAAAAGEELLLTIANGMSYREARLQTITAAGSSVISETLAKAALVPSSFAKSPTRLNRNACITADFVEVSVVTKESKPNKRKWIANAAGARRNGSDDDVDEGELHKESSNAVADLKSYLTFSKSDISRYKGDDALGKGDLWLLWNNVSEIFSEATLESEHNDILQRCGPVLSFRLVVDRKELAVRRSRFLEDRAKRSYPYPWHGGILWQVFRLDFFLYCD